MKEWTARDVEMETRKGYDATLPQSNLARLEAWFMARRGGPRSYVKWRAAHITQPYADSLGTWHTWAGRWVREWPEAAE
jgi:hypothetical protein